MASVRIDFSKPVGAIKPVHGVNSGPQTKVFTYDASALFSAKMLPSNIKVITFITAMFSESIPQRTNVTTSVMTADSAVISAIQAESFISVTKITAMNL